MVPMWAVRRAMFQAREAEMREAIQITTLPGFFHFVSTHGADLLLESSGPNQVQQRAHVLPLHKFGWDYKVIALARHGNKVQVESPAAAMIPRPVSARPEATAIAMFMCVYSSER